MSNELLNQQSLNRIAELANVDSVSVAEAIQSLWSGYGQILRVRLENGNPEQRDNPQTAIVKMVSPPQDRNHKYGWSNDNSHQRKLLSYDNELAWYQGAGLQCTEDCRIPQMIGGAKQDDGWIFILEDLDAAGFSLRRNHVSDSQLESCLSWLADFHAEFLHDRKEPTTDVLHDKLWPTGTYWHLATRPDELKAMDSGPLKQLAPRIDELLKSARFQTLVHGDAKLANFCFAGDDRVAAVDFQYVGGGCGVKDLAYFVSSCFRDDECEKREAEILNRYFGLLRSAIDRRGLHSEFKDEIEAEWRQLYPVAWADFYRFLVGWSPGHWKMHGYSTQMTQRVIKKLEQE
jgi:hypothetical protein